MTTIDDFAGGTLVRLTPIELPQNFKLDLKSPFPPSTNCTQGRIVHIEREKGKIRIITDHEDLRVCASEAKLKITPEPDGSHLLKPGYSMIAEYRLYKSGQQLPIDFSHEFLTYRS